MTLGTRPAVPGTRTSTIRRRRLVTNETAATGGVMYTDEGELEFDEDEMAALDFEGFHASEPAENLSGRNDSGSEAGHLSDAAAAAAYRTNPYLPD